MNDIDKAVSLLRAGGLVAFPTETVYGLGADALNTSAVEKIFAAKGRPGTNPLIAHVADAEVAQRYAKMWPIEAVWLTKKFWPGPLTIIVQKQTRRAFRISDRATAGRPTVGLRAPDHPIALELLRRFDRPVAAPSANRSNRVSPTTAEHVRDELGDAVDLVLDGGPCAVGIESTVLDLTTPTPMILRPGGISRAQIEAEIGPVEFAAGVTVGADTAAASPGQHAVHYAPRAAAFRFDSSRRAEIESLSQRSRDRAIAFLFLSVTGDELVEMDDARSAPGGRHFMPNDPARYARRLYAMLRGYDEDGVEQILIEMPPDVPEWAAVRDRLLRATQPLSDAR